MNNTENKTLDASQKETMALLSIGTFLEYFDLMLYVHMAVLLNDLFFPKADPKTASIIAAFTFSSTYVMRPFGALIFGYIGDHVGRKPTVIITTTLMSMSCIIMANVPTYNELGITASWIMISCRVIQGLSTMGEVMGANIYVIEITKPPVQYPAVALMGVCGSIGGFASLGIATFATSYGFNWRMAFWAGALIAIIGMIARTKLRETPDFMNAKLAKNKDTNINGSSKTALSLFFIECSWPVCFYFAYIYCGGVLKTSFDFSAEQVISNNFILSLIQTASFIAVALLSYRIYPLKILKVKLVIFLSFIIFCPYLLYSATSASQILFIQSFTVIFGFMGLPAMPIFYRHIPILKRFTYATFMYALSRAVIYVLTSFGLAYFSNYFGHWGILIVIMLIAAMYAYALYHFETIDKSELIVAN
jgi:MFS family permease